ncbi:hypothetical protein SUGI_0862540 [Cryptomeria japonica]|uniref:uncharacterized protein LOC131034414 isoform X2 n=1 Tax=Cryptomeria japonica TaxID=3369 RepID=UPI0024149515|nr:uncharacterized protein LOC131034414 isoform X2 [Cryptomeria japonica]GLJ41674.1 hypothetical protein SUGI_0862540 [Cryptomeria japonica]
MTRVPLKRFLSIDNSLTNLRNQLQACGKSVQAIFSYSRLQQSESKKMAGDKMQEEGNEAHGIMPPELSERMSSLKKISNHELGGNAEDSTKNKWVSQLAWVSNVLEPALQLYRRALPPDKTDNRPGPASTRSLVEIATNLHRSTIEMQEWSLGDLTLGLYLLSLRHASEMAVDNIKGEQIVSNYVVQDLIYNVELAKGAYLKDAASLARNSMLRESNILKFVSKSNVMRPGYYIGVDNRNKLVILGIRGTHTVHDLITDMVSHSNQEVHFDGFQVHFGTAEAARWFFCNELETLKKCLEKHEGFKLRLVGHSLGGAAAALLAIMLRKRSEEELGFSPDIVSSVGIATPPCVSRTLAESCIDFVTTVVLQDDAIPRMSGTSLARLRSEILSTDWTSLLEGEDQKGVIDLVANTMQALSSVQEVARKYAAYATSSSSSNDLGDKNMRETAGSYASSKMKLTGASSNNCISDPLALAPIESAQEELFTPGTLYHIQGRCVPTVDKKTTGGKENCTLWKGHPNEHFGRIVLSSTMFSDHKCDNHYYALRDVLKGLPKSDDRE